MRGQKKDKSGTIVQTDAQGEILHTEEGLVVGRGDKKKVIAYSQVEELAGLHCTDREMAEFFGISEDTLRYNFADIIRKAKAETKQRLRAAQLRHAINGNATLLIWLGKNMLGQSDAPSDDNTVTVLPWSDDVEKKQVEDAYNEIEGDDNATE